MLSGFLITGVLLDAKGRDGYFREFYRRRAFRIFPIYFLLLAIYFVGAEEGATSLIPGMYVHEFFHDGRHLLGFPCH